MYKNQHLFTDKIEYLDLDETSRIECFEKVLKKLKVIYIFNFIEKKKRAREWCKK